MHTGRYKVTNGVLRDRAHRLYLPTVYLLFSNVDPYDTRVNVNLFALVRKHGLTCSGCHGTHKCCAPSCSDLWLAEGHPNQAAEVEDTDSNSIYAPK
jgi:hypothetical protein